MKRTCVTLGMSIPRPATSVATMNGEKNEKAVKRLDEAVGQPAESEQRAQNVTYHT